MDRHEILFRYGADMLMKILLFPAIAVMLIAAVFPGPAGRQKLPVLT